MSDVSIDDQIRAIAYRVDNEAVCEDLLAVADDVEARLQRDAKVRYLTPEQISETCSVTKRTVYSWIEKGWLPAHNLGPTRLLRIREDDLAEFIGGPVTREVSP